MAKVKVKKKKKQALGFFSPSSQIPRLASGAPMSKVYKAKVPQASTKAAGSYTESAGTVVPAHVPDLKLPPDLSPVKISESPNTLSAVESSSSGPAPSDELNHPPTPSQVMGKNLTKPASPNLANLIQRSAQLEELGTPSTHISGAPFVLIPDENIEEAKEEFKEFIFARFISAQNVNLTVTFVYAFNQVEERRLLWEELSSLNASTPVSRYPRAVVTLIRFYGQNIILITMILMLLFLGLMTLP